MTRIKKSELMSVLYEELAEIEKEEQETLAKLAAMKSEVAEIRRRKRRITHVLDICAGNGQSGVTKEKIRPAVLQLLKAKGPLTQKQISDELTAVLKKNGIRRTGLSLVLKSLAPEFDAGDGTWALKEIETNTGPAENSK